MMRVSIFKRYYIIVKIGGIVINITGLEAGYGSIKYPCQ